MSDGSRKLSYGRCEDFALLYYALFRAVDVPASSMSFNLGVCDVPCSCSKAASVMQASINELSCYTPVNLTVAGNLLDGCSGILNKPDEYKGEFIITAKRDGYVYLWRVSQKFSGDNSYPSYRTLTLDGDYSNDVRHAIYGPSLFLNDILLLTDISGINVTAPINIIGNFSVIDVYPLSLLKDYNATFTLDVNISDLNNCNDEVNFSLGFNNSVGISYVLNEGYYTNLNYHGMITGYPYYAFSNVTPNCNVTFEVLNPKIIIDNYGKRELTSDNILTLPILSGNNLGTGVEVIGGFSNTKLSNLINMYTATYGFRISVSSLTDCSNDSVGLVLGFQGSPPAYYTLVKGDDRSVKYKGNITGYPYYSFIDSNPNCKVSFSISGQGLIIDTPCYKYSLPDYASDCMSYVTESKCYNESNPFVTGSVSIPDFINNVKCPV